MSQYPIIFKPSPLEQALAATPKPEPFHVPVIPSPGAKPRRFKVGLLAAQAVAFTVIALVPAFFGEFILAALLLAVTVGVILAQVNAQRVAYPRRLRIWEENVRGYEFEMRQAEQRKKAHAERQALLKTPEGIIQYRREQVKKALGTTRLPDGDKGEGKFGESEKYFKSFLAQYFAGKITKGHEIRQPGWDRPYQPDFTYVEPKLRLFIDIEIDEPYSLETRKAIHYQGKDRERNEYISEKYGWVVVRFSEEQVVRFPDSCCKTIAQVLAEITLDNAHLEAFANISDLSPEPQWTEEEGNARAIDKYRDSYLNLIPKPETYKPRKTEEAQPKKEFQPSEYQLAIFDFIENGQGHGLVVAVAGSGKSTTLLQAALRIKARSSIRTYAEWSKTLTLTLSQNGRGNQKKPVLRPFSHMGRRGWGMREISTSRKS